MRLPRIYPILDTRIAGGARDLSGNCRRRVSGRRSAHPPDPPQGALEPRASSNRQGRWPGSAAKPAPRLIVNDRADFALLLEAGLHVGQDDLAAARRAQADGPGCADRLLQPQRRHSSARPAANRWITWRSARCSPPRPRRNPDPVVGVDEVRRCRALIEKPLVAIGGITLENALDVFRAGADSVAVIAGLLPESAHGPLPARTDGRMATTRENGLVKGLGLDRLPPRW